MMAALAVTSVRSMNEQELVGELLSHRAEFLRFVERRVRDAAAAEDLLQEALLRAVNRVSDLRQGEALVGWFYRVLEHAVTDHHRRTSTASRAMEKVAREVDEVHTPNEAPARTCKCVHKVKAQLKPEYADALHRIEVDEVAVKDYAEEAGISRSNAAVRVFRAREALRAKVQATCGHCAAAGCTDCSCAS